MRAIDLRSQGLEHSIGCWQVGEVLIDPGPTPCIETLLTELGDFEPSAILLTHIHLDHAAATGALVERWPSVRVLVHEIGAPHMADPERLVSSTKRVWGDELADALFGEVIPVPQANIDVLSGGEELLGFAVMHTPGHASHHVSYLHRDSGQAFVGDVAGVRLLPGAPVVPPTPPPEIDVEAWLVSIEKVREWKPAALGITHFGQIDDPDRHLDTMSEQLMRYSEAVNSGITEEDFEQLQLDETEKITDPEIRRSYKPTAPPAHNFRGLQRYWRKRAEREAN